MLIGSLGLFILGQYLVGYTFVTTAITDYARTQAIFSLGHSRTT